MHAAKGLEWPVVVPINTMKAAQGPEKILVDRVERPFAILRLATRR